jgi:hypothetical protein
MTVERHGRFFNAVLGGSRRMPPGLVRDATAAQAAPTAAADMDAETGDPMVFDVFKADLGVGLPEGMALLTVVPVRQEDGMPGFRLRGVCCCDGVKELGEIYGRPDLELGSLVSTKGELPADVLSTMQTWSRPKAQLIRWLDRRRAAHGDEFQLVIWDDTGYRIPWELFWLDSGPASGRPDGWLGGLLTVTRWLSIRAAWQDVVRDYRSLYTCTGSVAAYVDAQMEHDQSLLASYQVEHSGSMYELTKALTAGTGALALVYVACHAEFGDQVTECALGQLPLVHVDPMRFARLMPSAAVVFLNACHSGSLGYDTKRFNDRVLRGFSEVFLRSGAAGVLATNGSVGDSLAFEMARDLLQHLRDNPGQPVAEAVRELRAQAARLTPADLAAVSGAEANKELLPLLYRFMYVYYGSPRTVITLETGRVVR